MTPTIMIIIIGTNKTYILLFIIGPSLLFVYFTCMFVLLLYSMFDILVFFFTANFRCFISSTVLGNLTFRTHN